MPRRIQGPDGKIHEFPDDFSDADVADALDGLLPPDAAPAPPASKPAGTHPLAAMGHAVVDAAKGAGAGALSTVYHGGDLIRRGLGMERVIDRPEVQAAITPPPSLAGQGGFLIEQGAEFAVPLSKLSTVARGMGLGKRVALDAAASAGVGALQSGGDTGTTALAGAAGAAVPVVGGGLRLARGAAQRAASGAAEGGGLGGAVAEAVRTVAPLDSAHLLVAGLKPRNTKLNFMKSIQDVLPDLKAAERRLGRPIAGIDDLDEALAATKKQIRADYDAIAGPKRDAGALVDLTPVGEAMQKSIPYKTRLERPEVADALLNQAKVYREAVPLERAELLLKETNAELESFYNKFPMAQRKALLADPEAARLNAQAKALRDAIYRTLDADGVPDAARALNRKYGQLMEIEDTVTRRKNVAMRQQPESLNEQFGRARAAGELARGGWKILHGDITGAGDIVAGKAIRDASKYLKEQQTTDALIRRAFAGVK